MCRVQYQGGQGFVCVHVMPVCVCVSMCVREGWGGGGAYLRVKIEPPCGRIEPIRQGQES